VALLAISEHHTPHRKPVRNWVIADAVAGWPLVGARLARPARFWWAVRFQ